MRSRTKSIHVGSHPDPRTGAVIPPIYVSTTFKQEAPGKHAGWDYSRAGHPTQDDLEACLASLEGGAGASVFSSGLAAENAIIQALQAEKKGKPLSVLMHWDVYGGTQRLFRTLTTHVELEFYDFAKFDPKDFDKKPDLVWLETPSNPLLSLSDIEQIASFFKESTVVVDNTFATPVFQKPLTMGVDLVVHSATKYLGGHSDLLAGVVVARDKKLWEQVRYVQFAAGAVLSARDCHLLHRSLKTLWVRMQAHEENAFKIAEFLQKQSWVSEVLYPGLESHPQHILATKQMSGFSGMVSFRVKLDLADVAPHLHKLQLVHLAESLGGVESLINHPMTMTHASVPEETRKKLGIDEGLFRLSVGIEDPEDLIEDLNQAFS